MREDAIPPNWVDLVQRSSQKTTPGNIDTKDTWFTFGTKDGPREVPNKKPLVSSNSNKTTVYPRENNMNIFMNMSQQYEPNKHDSLVNKVFCATTKTEQKL